MAKAYSAQDYLDGVPLPTILIRDDLCITVVELEDVGEVNFSSKPVEDETVEEDPDLERLEQLGLPAAFGSSKRAFNQTSVSKKKRRRKETQEKSTEHSSQLINCHREETTTQIAEDGSAQLRKRIGRRLFKYWLVRYSLFSRFDEGIQLDKQGWYSVTPECIARHQAQKYTSTARLVLDAFCGVGGNAIQFALNGHVVIAVDSNADRLRMAQHNATIYNVQNRIEFCIADVYELMDSMRPNLLFLSPPWGGPHYLHQSHIPFHSSTDLGYYLKRMWSYLQSTKNVEIVLYLPRNIDLCSMLDCALPHVHFREIEIIKVNGMFKAITVYMG